jgi:hypoxanthine phosphoribosyltransferase
MLDRHLEVLINAETLAQRIAELGQEIAQAYKDIDQPLMVVGVLKGAFIFMADLVRQIDLPMELDFLGLSSYGDDTRTSGVVKITRDLSASVVGRHVLIVEDIVDTGLTLSYMLDNLATRKPASVRICTLLHKPANARVAVPLDHVGFVIDDLFVIGYGLDLAEKYRNLPYIGHIVD